VLAALAAQFQHRPGLRIVDLACGTGAMLRAISPRLPLPQHWRLVDNDLGLLARAADAHPDARLTKHEGPPQVNVLAKPLDLVRDLELALEAPLDLITISALLDLVSSEWLDRLIIEAAARRLPIYAALTYDGRIEFNPAGEFDARLIGAFNRHQQTDKGFGPALGPAAATRAVERLEQLGFAVEQGRSDWILGPADGAMQEALFAGWADVGALRLPDAVIAPWLNRRRFELAAGRSRIRIGHVDIFARPIGIR
jgi:hypothetical protein